MLPLRLQLQLLLRTMTTMTITRMPLLLKNCYPERSRPENSQRPPPPRVIMAQHASPPSEPPARHFRFSVDRGGTFTDTRFRLRCTDPVFFFAFCLCV